jgi:ABC-type Fe3+ transport system substrate-binding protein/HEPN domain-containing protein
MSDSRRWIELALEDEKMAELAYREKLYNQVCFHCQQAGEKLLKAFLVEKEGRFPKVHSLLELLGLASYLDQSLNVLTKDSLYLDQFYVPTRYPDAPLGNLAQGAPDPPSARTGWAIRAGSSLHVLEKQGGTMTNITMSLFITLFFLLSSLPKVFGQTTESKLSWLESLPTPDRQSRLVETAKNEGEVIVYGNLNVVATKALTDGFMRKYPFVKARYAHFSGAAIINRVGAEARAGKVLSDVITSGQLGMLALVEKKMMARYRSPQREPYPEGLKDKEGYWTSYLTNVMVSAYNTNLVKKKDVPQSLEDLLKPRWKGKLGMDTQSYLWFGAVLEHLGEEAGLRYMRKLKDQISRHVRGRRLQTQLVIAGEFEMVVETNLNSVLTLAGKGAPVWFAPIRPLFLSPSLLFLTQGAPNPHAGALLIDYLLSEEGQRIVASVNRMPIHPKVESEERRVLEGLDIRMPDILDIGMRYNDIGRQYRNVFPSAR